MEWTTDHREWYRETYLKSKHWAELRARKLKANPVCERCPSTQKLEPHHVNYRNIFDVQLSDLETLCRRCHDKHHEVNGTPKREKLSYKWYIPEGAREKIRIQNKVLNRKKLEAEIILHVGPERKGRYMTSAIKRELTLNDWVIQVCDRAALVRLSEAKREPLLSLKADSAELVTGEGLILLYTVRIRKIAYVQSSYPGKLKDWMINAMDSAANN